MAERPVVWPQDLGLMALRRIRGKTCGITRDRETRASGAEGISVKCWSAGGTADSEQPLEMPGHDEVHGRIIDVAFDGSYVWALVAGQESRDLLAYAITAPTPLARTNVDHDVIGLEDGGLLVSWVRLVQGVTVDSMGVETVSRFRVRWPLAEGTG